MYNTKFSRPRAGHERETVELQFLLLAMFMHTDTPQSHALSRHTVS